ncbi:MAG: LysR family transcriptional regulator [Parvularculales bacterium]
MKLDPRHLELLAAIVDNGGVSEGAEALNKSQPSVSRSLRLLQDRVGVPLFEPNRRPLMPTEFCLVLAEQGKKIIEANLTASELISRAQTGHSGAVRVEGTPFFMDGVVSGILARFQSRFPDIGIEQNYGYPAKILEDLQNGGVDLGILPIRESEIPDNLSYSKILRGQNVIACRVGHKLSNKSSLRLAEIANYNWIAPPAGSPLYHDLRSALESIGVRNFNISFSGGTLSSVINVLSESDALTILPYSVVFNMRRQNKLSALSIRIGDPDRHLCIIHQHNALKNRTISRLENFVKSEIKTLQFLITQQEQNSLWRRTSQK